MINPENVESACRLHGAKVVSDAAYAAMEGRPAALSAVGLGHVVKMGDLYRVTSIAYELMPDDDKAADETKAAIGLARIAGRHHD